MRLFLLFVVAFSSSQAWLLPAASRKSRLTLFYNDASFWRHLSGESNTAFYKRLQQTAGDAAVQKAAAPDLPTVAEPKKKGYQRAEEWDAEQHAIAKEMTWEQRAQFDGFRHGDRVKQNEILQRHLKL
jgi:hypothetical protein